MDDWTNEWTDGERTDGPNRLSGPHLGERDADGVSETVQEKRADADGRLHASVLTLASLAAETSSTHSFNRVYSLELKKINNNNNNNNNKRRLLYNSGT